MGTSSHLNWRSIMMFFVVCLSIITLSQSKQEKNNRIEDSGTPSKKINQLRNIQDEAVEYLSEDFEPSLNQRKSVKMEETLDYENTHVNEHIIRKRSVGNRAKRGISKDAWNEDGENSRMECRSERSCEDQCSVEMTFTEGEIVQCHCDQNCEYFQDCCSDFHHYCSSELRQSYNNCAQTNSSSSNITGDKCTENITDLYIAYPNNITIQIDLEFFQCQPFRNKFDAAVRGVWMISDCADKGHASYDQCVNVPELSGKNIEDYIPVVDTNNNIFRNQHCAKCNNAIISQSWPIDLECDVSPPSTYSRAAAIDFLIQYCQKFSIEPPEVRFPLKYCYNLISDCPSSTTASDSVVQGCIDGEIAPVFVKPESTSKACTDDHVPINTNYKNINCSLCHGNDLGDIQCGPQEAGISCSSSTVKSFSIVMDFNRDESTKTVKTISVKCKGYNMIYDEHLETCRSKYETQGLPSAGDYDEYQIIMWMKSLNSSVVKRVRRWVPPPALAPKKTKAASVSKDEFIAAVSDLLGVNSTQLSGVNLKGVEAGDEAGFNLKIEPSDPSDPKNRNRRGAESTTKLLQVLQFTNPFDMPIGNKSYLVYKVASRHTTCLDTKTYSPDEYTLLDSGSVFINETGFEYNKKEFYVDEKDGVKYLIICGSYFITNCDGYLIALNRSEYTTYRNRSIYRMASNTLYEYWQYNSINNTVSICVHYSTEYTKVVVSFSTSPPDDEALAILTMIGFSLSIICLLFVLVTYIIFAKLRTLPGKNIMNLASALLVAHLLWLVGIHRTDNRAFCTAVAVLLHYFFLASFSWSAVISYDTCETFTQKGGPGAGADKDTVFIRYLVGAWSIPLVFILIFLSLDKADVYEVGYGTGDACWMSTKHAVIYLMVVPIAFVLIFNTITFVRTILAIKRASDVGQRARATGQRSEKQVFNAAVRLATLMGFTWIFGFAAPWAPPLWYPFVVFTTLQGVYIAFAFTMNRRVLNMYLQRCGLRQEEAVSKSASTSRAGSSVKARPSILSTCRKPKAHRTVYMRSNTEETKV